MLVKKDKAERPGRRPLIGFKAEADVASYFAECEGRGVKPKDTAHKAVRFIRDAEAETGDAVHDKIERLAEAEGISVGRMFGRLAALGLKSRR
jgi:hypothetical protein